MSLAPVLALFQSYLDKHFKVPVILKTDVYVKHVIIVVPRAKLLLAL